MDIQETKVFHFSSLQGKNNYKFDIQAFSLREAESILTAHLKSILRELEENPSMPEEEKI